MGEVEVWRRYVEALDRNTKLCSTDPSRWHQPDTRAFTQLRDELLIFAREGSARCQYAVATIHWMGLCCESEEEYVERCQSLLEEATVWWVLTASQGHYWALDNLLTCGVGPEAERVRVAARQLELQKSELVGDSEGIPIYGLDFMQELCRTIYGRTLDDV